MKKYTLLAISILMALTTLAQDYEPKTITLTDAERRLVEQNSDFAFNLFRKTRGTDNHVISPLSITYALGMLNNGADGVTREEICRVLSGGQETGYADIATMNAFCRKMLTESNLLDEDTRVAIANTIYFNGDRKELSLKTAFKNAAAAYYDATPSVLSFSDKATLGIINQWATDHTDGMIHDLLKESDMEDPNLVSFLLNAICFKGAWVNQFDEKQTQYSYFDNAKRTAMMMWQHNEFRYAENNLYQSIILPYGNGSYQMTIFLPWPWKKLDDVVADLNGTNWNAAEYETYMVSLGLPRIETDTNQDLEEIMQALGMENAFYPGHGFNDFCYFGDNEDNSDPCWISMMRQKAHLKLDEKGTEAAAATVIAMSDKAESKYTNFNANRPFLYIISERSTGSIFFIGQYMGDPLKNQRHDVSLTAEEKELVKGNNDFAFRLFSKARGDESCIMSPLSVTYALGMINNGAAGQTQKEICDVLGFGDAGADGINQFCRKMLTEAPTLDEETTAEIANTIYVNSGMGYELQQGFVDKAYKFYDATPEALDFYDGSTIGIINQWASNHTHGMIPEIVNEGSSNRDADSYLLNAIYFKGTWTNKFYKEFTTDEPFNGGAPEPMMWQNSHFDYADNDLYQAIRLPYGNGAYLMTLFLPREGKTIADVLSGMDGHNWQFRSSNEYDYVDLKMPRFKTEACLNLVKILINMGMPTAFSVAAEFPYFGNRPVSISNIFQKAVIDLDEEGTTAAAITVGEMGESSGYEPRTVTFHANRPFFYIISERSTGTIFFIGQFLGSVTAGIPQIEKEGQKTENTVIYDLQGRKVGTSKSSLKPGIYIIGGNKVMIK